jgi:hypothetical protein
VVFRHAAAVAQAGGAVVAGAGGDLREAVGHGGMLAAAPGAAHRRLPWSRHERPSRPAHPFVERRPVPPAMLDALRARFGDRCSTPQAVREQHGRDESPYDVAPPEAVVFCESTDDVAAIVVKQADRMRCR